MADARAIQQALQRAAAGEARPFLLERRQSAGEPIAWRERTFFRSDATQEFFRMRSWVDDGGEAIGDWAAPADPARGPALAAAALAATGWGRGAEGDVGPGMDIVEWRLATPDGELAAQDLADGPVAEAMAPLDMELRRLANALQEAGQGPALRLEARVEGGRLRLAFLSAGRAPVRLLSPLGAAQDDRSYLRLELAPMPEAPPGYTAPDPVYAPVPTGFALSGGGSTPDARVVTVTPEAPLVLETAVARPTGPALLRAVYSNYRDAVDAETATALRGRAFSNVIVST